MFDAHVLNVLISAPGDTGEEVEAVKKSLHGFNSARAEADSVVLLPRNWKSDAVPRLGSEGAQGVINTQLVDKADIVIALFDSRLGQATPNAVSGTAEEIQRAVDAGKHVHVWFSNEDIPRDADRDQLAALDAFRKDLQNQGLLGQYADPEDLAYKVRQAIGGDVAELGLGPVQVRRRGAEHAMPRAQHDGDKRLFIENKSEVVKAEQLSWELEDARNFKMRQYTPVDLPPLSHMDWWVLPLGRMDQTVITMRWSEDGQAHEESQTISV